MKSCLYFICPTDSLETIIDRTFHQGNYFYSSLGNAVNFSQSDWDQIKRLIYSKGIREIYFILSDDNRVVLDALGNQEFSNTRGLKKLYKHYLQVTILKKVR